MSVLGELTLLPEIELQPRAPFNIQNINSVQQAHSFADTDPLELWSREQDYSSYSYEGTSSKLNRGKERCLVSCKGGR